jgi:hypothetical protein
MLSEDPATSSKPGMAGSWLILRGSSQEAIRKFLMDDVYVSGGAWDASKMQITPIVQALGSFSKSAA